MKFVKNNQFIAGLIAFFAFSAYAGMQVNPYKRVRPLDPPTVDYLAAKYVPVVTANNTVNMDWLKETLSILGQQGVTVNLSNEAAIKNVATALWSSSIFQNAMNNQINTFQGNKSELKQRFWESLTRSLDEIQRQNVTRMRGRLGDGLNSPSVIKQDDRLTDRSTLPWYMRTVRGNRN